MSTKTRDLILQAVARGWCHPGCTDIEMDSNLALAITEEVLAALASGQQAPEPVAWEVYVAEQQNGYIVDDLEDPQLVDDLTNHNAELTPLYRAPPQAPEPVGWVSVEERLPEDGQSVAFVVACKNPSYDYLDGKVLGGLYRPGPFGGFGVPGLTINASHWMPLPPAPTAPQAPQGADQ